MGECRGLGCLPLLGLCVRPSSKVLGWPVTVDAGYYDDETRLWFELPCFLLVQPQSVLKMPRDESCSSSPLDQICERHYSEGIQGSYVD